jgi:peroxiredoxin
VNMIRRTLMLVAVALVALVGSRLLADEIAIGAAAPDFKAKGVDGKDYSLASTKGAKATVLCFTCNSCPVAVAYEDRLIRFANQYGGKGVKFIAINCNNATENLKVMKQRAEEKGFTFPYAFDESGDAARAYGARVTPHLFIVDQHGKIAYRGAFDDNIKDAKENYVAAAVDELLGGKTPQNASTKAFGCGIKLK